MIALAPQVQEKEARIRVMMRMMGLGTAAYWAINYAFWVGGAAGYRLG